MPVQLPVDQLLILLLAIIRSSAWLLLVPPFNTRAIPAPVKMALAVGISLPVIGRPGATAPVVELGPLLLAVLMQVGVGVALGLLTLMLFSAVQAAGDAIDMFASFTVAVAYDPLSNASTAVFGRLHQLVAMLLLFATNGHLLLVQGFYDSYRAIPVPMGVDLSVATELLTANLGVFFLSALQIALPLIVALTLTDVAMGLLSRGAPQLNVFSLGFAVKILVTLLVAGIGLALLPAALTRVLGDITRAVSTLLGAG
ncbi:MAG: flagellar biosynthetic protein FliR [Actinomycetota bacterium]|nr:flagellar biosynthetic protein FliR [Actinomycetota bacterium]